MKKDEFLKKLETSLAKLDEEDRKKVLRKYKNYFTRKKNQNMSEEEIVESLGNYNDLINSILKEYNISNSTEESASTINNFFKDFIDVVEEIVKYISKQEPRNVIKLVLQLIIILIFLSLLKLPIIFVRDLLSGLFTFLFSPLDNILIFCWRFLCEIAYIIIALTIFVKSYLIIIKPKLKKRKRKTKKVKSV